MYVLVFFSFLYTVVTPISSKYYDWHKNYVLRVNGCLNENTNTFFLGLPVRKFDAVKDV